ncbi:MAG: 3-deoxy-7-phosphoheptulonate synthase [Gammaproteobacteria bacterium RIFCSPHIGHO2_12_FULL_35_23]|nr:MAG: 3-deoxy-7-phosphoheptulonate synthase [Gammaproteobacteria bacterium RIFCSPHIGHO2_12_FULL_35_23]
MLKTDDTRIASLKPIISPAMLIHNFPLSYEASKLIQKVRQEATQIIHGQDDRLLVIVGPCSIHDKHAALEYGKRLKNLIEQYKRELLIVMRVYFEKPRTTIGWKGLINDPHLDNSFDINTGLSIARQLLVELTELSVPAATEFLDSIVPQYISDVISWGAIGARTTESQVHRELASGLSMPIGFKNGTDGNIKIAIDAIQSASHRHHFLSISKLGVPIIAETIGNDSTHVILRGSNHGPNYEAQYVNQVAKDLIQAKLFPYIMIDCSHGNSEKDYTKQVVVANNLYEQLREGCQYIAGVMLESNLVAGNQALVNKEQLVYGQSITDACIDWQETEQLLKQLSLAVCQRREKKL